MILSSLSFTIPILTETTEIISQIRVEEVEFFNKWSTASVSQFKWNNGEHGLICFKTEKVINNISTVNDKLINIIALYQNWATQPDSLNKLHCFINRGINLKQYLLQTHKQRETLWASIIDYNIKGRINTVLCESSYIKHKDHSELVYMSNSLQLEEVNQKLVILKNDYKVLWNQLDIEFISYECWSEDIWVEALCF